MSATGSGRVTTSTRYRAVKKKMAKVAK